VALGAAWWLGAPLSPIVLACALVISLELVNTAVEAVVDLVSPEPHPLAGVAKDVAAGAVLAASLFALGVALVELLPRLLARW
jgi:diacylglycerol kinase (ATP)